MSTRLEPVRTLHPSPDDIQKLEQLRRSLVPRLREGFDKAVEYGLDETNRILFDYARNYRWDDLAEQLVPYWKWPSRNILQAVDSHLRHPKVWWLIYRTRDHVASVNKEAGLRTRLKYTVHVPGYSAAVGSLLRYMGLEEHIEARIDPFRYVSWLGSLPGSTPYKQRELERLRQEREEGPAPIIEQARRLGEQFGIGLYPWWEFTLGYMGVFGDDWYPRQVIPWSRTIEYFTGVNPDYLFHKASTTILSELGVPRMLTKGYNALGISPPKVDLIEWGTERPDRWLNFSMGRRARNQLIRQYLDGVPPRDIKVDVNKAREDALTLAFVSEALGHATGLYFKEWSVEEAVSKQMTEEYRRLPSKAARKEWYEKYPWWGEHSRSWDKFADTPDRLRRAERRQILSDFYAAYNELRDRHIRERQELFRQHPMVWWRMRKLKDAQWEEREELERQYEEKLKATLAEGETLPALWQWQLFPQKRYNKATGEWEEFYNILPEEYREHHISQLAQALSRTLPRRSWFIRDDGTFDSEGYYWAREKWFAALPGLEDYEPGPPANKTWERARRTPTPVLQSLIQRMVEAGMPGEAARQFVTLGLTRDDLERAWMKNDTPEEALQSVYYDRVIKLAGERMAEIKKISDPAERAQAYEELFAAFPAMPATAFAWDIYVRYKDVKPEWTPLFLVQALQDITLPSYEDYLHNNKTGREWLISAINQLYFAQHWRNRRILREKIPALQIVAERRKYRLDHPEKNLTSSYDYDIISLGELKDVLNALEQLTGRPITEWDDIPQLAAAVPPVAAAAGLVAAARPEPEAYEGIIPTREGAPPPTLPPTEGVPPRMPPPRAGGVVITWPTDKTEFVELTTDEITGDESLLGKYGVARLYTPEELAEANEAQRINELAWAAKEAGNDEEAEKWFSHPLWIKWYGNTPKSRFWREYRRLVPPGWRGRPLRETDIIQTILNKGLRAFLSDEAYEEGLRLIQEYAATYPHLIEGDPEEWEQAKRMAEEYFSIEDPEERKEYAAAHPLFVKYYFAPPGWPESRFARERKKPAKKERLERGELAAQQATAPQDPAEFTEVTTDEITGAALLAAYGLVPL
ncbi:MAG TPA: hypothetical protein EYP85_16935, partial [Armatimonadetes bacterium]|nr:hypothetical protein [Armatimonadota bacterium]